MIHIGSRKTLRTKCGKPVARRWWVDDALWETANYAGLVIGRRVDPRQIATCEKCIKAMTRNRRDRR